MRMPSAAAATALRGGEGCSTSCSSFTLGAAPARARAAGAGVCELYAPRRRRAAGVRGQRVLATLTEPPPSSTGEGARRAREAQPLIRGGNIVEEEALASALHTVDLQRAGLLEGRSMKYDSIDTEVLNAAYLRCGEVTEDYGRTFYLATQLMNEQRRKAIWAIYVWCRRTDELVDGPNASYITPSALDRWTERLDQVFDGRPYDLLDAALTDTVSTFPVDIKPFYDMVDGMRMDLIKLRYNDFGELYEYCYRVAGTVALMSVPIMGMCPKYKGPTESVYRAALALGLANQLTNILRDVGEDVKSRGRIYIPLEDLHAYGIDESEVLNCSLVKDGVVDQRWKDMMKFQIARARQYFHDAEEGISGLDKNARWPVWAALVIYSKILDAIEANDYDNFNRRAYVTSQQKLLMLPVAYAKAQWGA